MLFLFVLGTGLGSLASHGLPPGISFKTFIYPGVVAMGVLFTAIFSAGSIVWDREFGFLREMLVAPVNRGSIVLGKCFGGATVATFQGIIVLALAGLADVPYNPILIIILIGELLLLSFTLTAFGVMMAARIKSFQAFMALTQMLVMPLFFLSGALYPLNGLPAWLTVLTRIDPLTYIVAPMRRAVFSHLNLSPAALNADRPGRLLGRLGRACRPLPGHRRGHGRRHGRHSHRRVQQDGVTHLRAAGVASGGSGGSPPRADTASHREGPGGPSMGRRPSMGRPGLPPGGPGGRPPGRYCEPPRRTRRSEHGATSEHGAAGVASGGSGGSPPGQILRATAKDPEVRAWGDAGWLRGQTTRRRIHRRSDGGPERR